MASRTFVLPAPLGPVRITAPQLTLTSTCACERKCVRRRRERCGNRRGRHRRAAGVTDAEQKMAKKRKREVSDEEKLVHESTKTLRRAAKKAGKKARKL